MKIDVTTPKHTIIRLAHMDGRLERVTIPYDEATCEMISQTVIDLITQTGMDLTEGDIITIQTGD